MEHTPIFEKDLKKKTRSTSDFLTRREINCLV